MSRSSAASGYTCLECRREFDLLHDAVVCCAPHPEGTVAVVDSEGVGYGG